MSNSELTTSKIADRDVVTFDPERHRLKIAAIEYGIEEAKRIKDWPKLEEAVDLKIKEQVQFVGWWKTDVGANQGAGRGKKNRVHGSFSVPQAEDLTGMKQQRVSDLGARLKDLPNYRLHLLGTEHAAAMLESAENFRALGTGENEWFTPAIYIDLARQVLGDIDLDPATHEESQKTVQAKKYFTKEDDGLKHEWHGRVWLNPPYSAPIIRAFAAKLCEEYRSGRTSAAIMLTHNYTDSDWFQKAARVADAICFARDRVKFYAPSGKVSTPTQGQAFLYFGNQRSQFVSVFGGGGFVVALCEE